MACELVPLCWTGRQRSLRCIPISDHAAKTLFTLNAFCGCWACEYDGQGVSLVHHIHRPLGRVGLGRCRAVKGGMRPHSVVEVNPLADDAFGHEAVSQLVQIDHLVFQRPPQALDEDVVHAPAPPVHRDRDPGVLENAGEVEAGELAALVGVEHLGLAMFNHRLAQGFDAEPGVHGVRQPPRQDMARRPVHDRDQIQEALRQQRCRCPRHPAQDTQPILGRRKDPDRAVGGYSAPGVLGRGQGPAPRDAGS